jgi:hypothetical protein
MSPSDYQKKRFDLIQNAILRDKKSELTTLFQEIVKGLSCPYDQKGLMMVFEHMVLPKGTDHD